MKPIYDSHVLKFRDVLLPRDHQHIFETLSSCRGEQVIAKVRHEGRVLEVDMPCGELENKLRDGKIDPAKPFDLEIVTRRPHRVDSGRPSLHASEDFEDRNDFNVLQWNGDRGTGNPHPRTLRHTPMFFRENGMNFDLVDLHAGQSLFLVLNGPSLTGFDWSRLKQPGIVTMGINNGAHLLRPNYWTCVDDPSRFMASIWKDPAITKLVPMAHFQKPIWDRQTGAFSTERVRDFPNVIGFRRNECFEPGRWLSEDTINWGNHSKRGGGRSVMLSALRIAHLLGFRKVYLLGCDFHMDEKKHYWFPEQRSGNAISNNTNSYALMRAYFRQLQPRFLEAGFEVFNCNPESCLDVFPFTDLDQALDSAVIDMADSTEGMYIDRYREAKRVDEERRRPPASPPRSQPKKSIQAGPRNDSKKHHTTPDLDLGEPIERLIGTIENAAASAEPFFHVRLGETFSDSFYAEMLRRLPETRHYTELRHRDAMQADGSSARRHFQFSAAELSRLPEDQRRFWSGVRALLMDRRVEAAMRRVLAPGLRQRFADKAERVLIRPVPTLVRDLTGYRIGVHTDIFQKVITCQFYLPDDEQRPELGTTFCRRCSDGKVREVMTLPFLPQTGYAFAVTKESFHEVKRLDLGERPRNSLMLTYYLRET